MTVYPMHPEAMLHTERALIVNEAVAWACFATGNAATRLDDAVRWWALGDIYDARAKRRRLCMEVLAEWQRIGWAK